jgi:hypothetical protein
MRNRRVAQLCVVMSIRHVSEFYALDWKTIKAIDCAHPRLVKTRWTYRHAGYAERFWQQWYRRAMYQPPGGYQQQDQGHPANGLWFRDDHYFFLRIRAAFPGNG